MHHLPSPALNRPGIAGATRGTLRQHEQPSEFTERDFLCLEAQTHTVHGVAPVLGTSLPTERSREPPEPGTGHPHSPQTPLRCPGRFPRSCLLWGAGRDIHGAGRDPEILHCHKSPIPGALCSRNSSGQPGTKGPDVGPWGAARRRDTPSPPSQGDPPPRTQINASREQTNTP